MVRAANHSAAHRRPSLIDFLATIRARNMRRARTLSPPGRPWGEYRIAQVRR